MAKYKSYNYSQTVMVPVSLEDQLMEGTLELAGDISAPHEDSRASICQYTNAKTVRPLYLERKDQGKHPVVTLLYGTQYREDSKLWICVCGNIGKEK